MKFNISKTEHDALSDEFKSLYKAEGDGFQIQIEGAVAKTELDKFRNANVELLKAQKDLDGIDMKKYNEMMINEQKIKDKELIDAGEIDKLIEQKTAAVRSDYDAKITNLQSELEKSQNAYKSTVSKYEIEGAASKAFATHKISPEAQDAVMSQIRNKFTISEGSVVAMEGDKILTGSNGNLTIDEFVAGQPEIFKVPSNGGQGKGGHNHQETAKKTAAEKIASGLEKSEG